MNIQNKLLCLLGFHKWIAFKKDNWSYRRCEYCEKLQERLINPNTYETGWKNIN